MTSSEPVDPSVYQPLAMMCRVPESTLMRMHVDVERLESLRSSMDSVLEAFRHNPTHGSVAPLAVQPGAKTKYANQRFLSY